MNVPESYQLSLNRFVFSLTLLLVASPAVGTQYVDMPQVCGTHVDASIVFTIELPRMQDVASVSLELSGTQSVGTRGTCTALPPFWRYAGAEVELHLQWSETPEIFADYGFSEIPATDGEWTHSFPLHAEGFLSTLCAGGSIDAVFNIGSLIFNPLCGDYLTMPVTTIVSARLVVDGTVATEHSTWGTVKQLYR